MTYDIVLQEDIKSLTCYIVEKHYEAFESVAYVQTFKNLKQRYEQHQDRLKDKTNLERSVKLQIFLSPLALVLMHLSFSP